MDVEMKIKYKRCDEKNKWSSGRMESNCLIHDCNIYSTKKYLNISVDFDGGHAGVGEWLTRLSDTCFSKMGVSII